MDEAGSDQLDAEGEVAPPSPGGELPEDPIARISAILPPRNLDDSPTGKALLKAIHGARDSSAQIEVPGDVLDIFAVVGENMMQVFFAVRRSNSSLVCIRVINKSRDDEVMSRRFARERRFMAKRSDDHVKYWPEYFGEALIDHPQYGTRKIPCALIEALAGTDLLSFYKSPDERIKAFARSPQFVLAVAIQLCHAIELYEEEGWVNRDFKPENILIMKPQIGDIFVKLFDGSTLWEPESDITDPGIAIGTPHYMASEQVIGYKKTLSGRTDLYAVGMIMYRLLTDKLPFNGPTQSILRDQISTQPPPITADIPDSIKEIVYWFLRKNPGDRPPDARAARKLLVDYFNYAYPNDPLRQYFSPALDMSS